MTVFDLCRRQMRGDTAIREGGDLLLLGRNHADLLRTLGDDLEPINRDYFTGRHAQGELPLIMNYYRAVPHGPIKREHLAHTRQRMGDDFLRRMSAHVQGYFESLASGDQVDLVLTLTESVIEFHLREFLGLQASRDVIRSLAYFEDHFTMGLYLGPEELDAYYDAASFVPHREAFHSLVHQWLDLSTSLGSDTGFTPTDFVYNFSAAGSTNVAKAFVYGLQLMMEHGQEEGQACAPVGAEAMLCELLRFLPLVDNQVVPCFVARRPSERGRAWLAQAGFGDIDGNVYVFHALHNADPQRFSNPERFDPRRWRDPSLASSHLMTFGVGSHACCGRKLAEAWLRTLFHVWQSRFRLAAPLELQGDPFVETVPRAQRLTSRAALVAR